MNEIDILRDQIIELQKQIVWKDLVLEFGDRVIFKREKEIAKLRKRIKGKNAIILGLATLAGIGWFAFAAKSDECNDLRRENMELEDNLEPSFSYVPEEEAVDVED
jgi:hypothetical protein